MFAQYLPASRRIIMMMAAVFCVVSLTYGHAQQPQTPPQPQPAPPAGQPAPAAKLKKKE